MTLQQDLLAGAKDTVLYGGIFVGIRYARTGSLQPTRWAVVIPVMFVLMVVFNRYLSDYIERAVQSIFS